MYRNWLDLEMCDALRHVLNGHTYCIFLRLLVRDTHWFCWETITEAVSNRLWRTTHLFISISNRAWMHRSVENIAHNNSRGTIEDEVNWAVCHQRNIRDHLDFRSHVRFWRVVGSEVCSKLQPFRALCDKEPRCQRLLTTWHADWCWACRTSV